METWIRVRQVVISQKEILGYFCSLYNPVSHPKPIQMVHKHSLLLGYFRKRYELQQSVSTRMGFSICTTDRARMIITLSVI